MLMTSQIILASSSSYRKELFTRLGLPFLAIAPDINEDPRKDETALSTALRLAQQKAEAIAALYPNTIIIGSDQVAILNGEQIGKPGDHARALEQLQKMRGQEVLFHTALCVLDNRTIENESTTTPAIQRIQLQNCQTAVKFRDLPDDELNAYLHIEKPYDCAGSAKNEGLGIAIIESIQSEDPTALTGLPLIALTSMLRHLKVEFFRA
jgi:septum formation protein